MTLVRRALAEVRTVPVLLVVSASAFQCALNVSCLNVSSRVVSMRHRPSLMLVSTSLTCCDDSTTVARRSAVGASVAAGACRALDRLPSACVAGPSVTTAVCPVGRSVGRSDRRVAVAATLLRAAVHDEDVQIALAPTAYSTSSGRRSFRLRCRRLGVVLSQIERVFSVNCVDSRVLLIHFSGPCRTRGRVCVCPVSDFITK